MSVECKRFQPSINPNIISLTPRTKFNQTAPTMINITPKQFRKAANIQEKIQLLQKELGQLLGSSDETAAMEGPKKKRKMSAAGRAAIQAAQKARWAKLKGLKVQKPKRKFTAAGRARLAALAKARWAKVKAAGKSRL